MKLLLTLLLLFFSCTAFSQSIHQEKLLLHPDNETEQIPAHMLVGTTRSTCNLNKTVFGWHPYWVNGLEANYDWNLISDLCYFAYEVDPTNGTATSTHSWATANVIDTALAHGKKVHLCVTLFSQHATFFGNSSAQNTLINNLVNLLQTRGAHGVNIDFEGVPASQSANLTTFLTNLGNALHTANANYQLSVCLYAVDWSNVFNEPALSSVVDFFAIMGYDYYYSGSSQAGPVDPLYGFSASFDYSLSRSVSYYLNAGIPTSKLILGLPYYGREWETTSNVIPGTTTGNNVYSRTYKFVRDDVSGNYVNPVSNTQSSSTAFLFQNAGTWRQCWISEANNLKDRYDLVQRRNLKGIGIWTLGYDDGYSDLWDAISDKLTDCYQWACTDTLYDEGGAQVDYYNNELVQYTIAPVGATALQVDFLEFATEADFDTLWLYDGPTTTAPLIGAYTGTAGPGQFTTTTGMLTLRFKSDGSTRASGWKLAYTCIQDDEAPTSAISAGAPWITEDFTAQFDDQDNITVAERYWNVQSLISGEWQSNPATGHVYDQFPTIGSWNTPTGLWEINNGAIVQTDDANGNTNAYLSSPLTGAAGYVFQWKGAISGSGTNRRAGMHFMCDDLTLPNRGNSYFVWFRVDSDVIQLYEVTNDVFSLTASFPYTIDPATAYDCKVTYSLATGTMAVYVNDAFLGSWTDPTPLIVSTGISLRSGNAQFSVDQVGVYPMRDLATSVLVGSTGHFTQCNPSPAIPAGSISSLVIDGAHNVGSGSQTFDVDFTQPIVAVPQEELTDIDTLLNTTTLTLANLIAMDTNSGLAAFSVWIEELDGTMLLAPTPVTGTTLLETLAGLTSDQHYRIRIIAENGAGLTSDTVNSDGFIYLNTTGLAESGIANALQFYPNPAGSSVTVIPPTSGILIIFSMDGRNVFEQTVQQGQPYILDVTTWSNGTYWISLGNQSGRLVKE